MDEIMETERKDEGMEVEGSYGLRQRNEEIKGGSNTSQLHVSARILSGLPSACRLQQDGDGGEIGKRESRT